MLFGDVTYGGLQRAYLEKVNGEYQGAVFRHTQGLEAGVNRISPDRTARSTRAASAPTATGARKANSRFGLQKLTPNGADAFDIKAMRATRTASSWSTPSRSRRRPPPS